jgi:hypothetical protein
VLSDDRFLSFAAADRPTSTDCVAAETAGVEILESVDENVESGCNPMSARERRNRIA